MSSRPLREARECGKPIIGIPTGLVSNTACPGELIIDAQEQYKLAVRLAGGFPVLVEPLSHGSAPDSLDELADRAGVPIINGWLLTGGPDVDPGLYGQGENWHPKTYGVRVERDNLEIGIVRLIRELAREDKDEVYSSSPVLAICRGLQVANVALSGSLHQHLPDLLHVAGTETDHISKDESLKYIRHDIIIAATEGASELGSRLLPSRIVGLVRSVPSHHHQGLATLGEGLEVIGEAPDKVPEVVKSTDRRLTLLGVQFHPELAYDEYKELFEGHIREAARSSVTSRKVRRAVAV